MKIDGACHCGFIAYEATIDPEHVGICHCTDCQTLSGSAFRTYVLAPRDGFRLLTGQPKIYVKTSESGAKRTQAFCPECGTPIYSSAPNDPQVFSIRAGTVRQRNSARSKAPDLVSVRPSLADRSGVDRTVRRATAAATLGEPRVRIEPPNPPLQPTRASALRSSAAAQRAR